jgi:hypothetical protein
MPGPLRRRGDIPSDLALLDEPSRGTSDSFTQPRPFTLEPALKLPGTGDEESLEQITPIAVEGIPEPFRRNGIVESDHVAPEPSKIESDFLVAARQDDVPERAAEYVQCLAQCPPRVFLVELGPKQREQAVAAMESSGSGGGEVGEQSETARSSEQPLDLMSRSIGQLQGPEHPELDHATLFTVTASGDGTVTTW